MQIVRISELEGTSRDVHCPNGGFRSLRAILASEGMGFSMSKTIVPAGKRQHWHYTNHLEACYCIGGQGVLVELPSGKEHFIFPDTVYVLDKHDAHDFIAFEDVTLICIFNPPLIGREVHRSDGSYASSALFEKLDEVKEINRGIR